MKPTGATKEATGHSSLPWQWLPDEGQFIVDVKGNIVAEVPCQGCNPVDGEFIITAVNERERLRAAIDDAIDKLERASLVQDHSVHIIKQACRFVAKNLRAALNEVEG